MTDSKQRIYVTQPFLPPLEEFLPYLEEIWESKILTNGGPFHQKLETALSEYLGIEHLSLFANGTIALVTALQSLGIRGEVITTPYSFVATSHSLLWNGITPVFVDVDPVTLNIDPMKIESAITSKTSAILGVHCYGRPCDVDAIAKIATKHNLKVIYDAAHAFGVRCHCGSVLSHGDLSILSFHATKVYNTFEGGAIVSQSPDTKKRIDNLKNFGFIDEVTVASSGINGKMSEVNAAFGLLQLKYVDSISAKRKFIDSLYRTGLQDVQGIVCLNQDSPAATNYSYFPILVKPEYRMSRDSLYEKLRAKDIYARRYFYPLISDFPIYKHLPSADKRKLPVARSAAEQILCLPIYPDLAEADVMRIVSLVNDS